MLRFLLIMLLVVISDQLTKLWIVENFALGDSMPVIPGFFNLVLVHNTGAAFGMLSNMPLLWRQVFFVGVATTALIVMVLMQRRLGQQNPLYAVSFGLISGGAVGNVIDRLKQGSVIDFLDFHIKEHHWPAFNVADSGITVGVGLFLLLQYLEQRADTRQQKVA
ncbi:MAG: signal peptidase II [Candidatus Electronema sp. V4]|uniref:signal peptidase II n=1 Tax=Candidatus Electronema sp. V4 TaxID=3454756 RepID=UPI00405556F4